MIRRIFHIAPHYFLCMSITSGGWLFLQSHIVLLRFDWICKFVKQVFYSWCRSVAGWDSEDELLNGFHHWCQIRVETQIEYLMNFEKQVEHLRDTEIVWNLEKDSFMRNN